MQTIKVYISLLEEGTDTLRPTQAVALGDNVYELLPTPQYDPENETWEFLPGTKVVCEEQDHFMAGKILVAIRPA